MADTFGKMEAGRGESLSNPGFSNRFTCPGCYTDHDVTGSHTAKFIRCECGAPLRLQIEDQPVAVATICDEDEETEELPS